MFMYPGLVVVVMGRELNGVVVNVVVSMPIA